MYDMYNKCRTEALNYSSENKETFSTTVKSDVMLLKKNYINFQKCFTQNHVIFLIKLVIQIVYCFIKKNSPLYMPLTYIFFQSVH